jgi:hypothetical protein
MAGSLELRFDQKPNSTFMTGYQLYSFADSDVAWNAGYRYTDGISLVSVGGGARKDLSKLTRAIRRGDGEALFELVISDRNPPTRLDLVQEPFGNIASADLSINSCYQAGMTVKCIRYLTALVAIGVCEVSHANAQVLVPNPTPEMYVATNKGGSRIVPNGQLRFDGQSFTCGRFPTVEDPLLHDYAAAPYKGFLIINPTVFTKVPTTVKLWIYQHECAHALGIPDETKADCYSVSKLRLQGLLPPQGLDQVCDFISAGQADATHPAGPARCAAMRTCYSKSASGADPKASPSNTVR